jgi:nucleotide-binding universal stress UspA family protein
VKLLTTSNPQVSKILWAVDAFHENPKEQLKAGKAISLLFKDNPVVIQPVSVLLTGKYVAQSRAFLEKWSELAGLARRNLDKLFKDSNIKNLEEPRLIKQSGPSMTGAVGTLLSFALEEKCDLIVVSSHSRKGADRLFMGSFAETLVLRSPIPVLVLNPKSQPKGKLKHIVFPTDFSEASEKAYFRVVELARETNSEILLMHNIEPFFMELGYPFLPPVSAKALKEFDKRLAKTGQSWVRRAEAEGAAVKFYLSHKPGPTLDEILRISKRNGSAGMIAMASQSGPARSVLLGSLTRQVLRSANCPVLVIHPHQEVITAKIVAQLKRATETQPYRPVLA